MVVGVMLLLMDKMIRGEDSTYIAECSIDLLKCAHMTGIWRLSSQDGVPAVHPPQSSLTLEAAYGRVCDDSGN
jgi:hypothetical protein